MTEYLKYGVGIDMAMETFDVCLGLINREQQVHLKAHSSFANDAKGFAALLKWVKQHTSLAIPTVYLMEATGIYYEQLAWFLHKEDCHVSVVLPNKAKQYKKSLGLKSKTDRIDAGGLARMCCEQSHKPWQPVSNNLYLLRLLTRQIQSITEQLTSLSNQLHALQHGMFRDKEIEKMFAGQVKLFQKNKATLQNRVEELVNGDVELKSRFEKILKIKGLGLQNLAVIVAETAGFTAFQSIAQLVSYAGYDVVEDQSGKRSGKTKISKQGNAHIRKCLHFPAFNVVRYAIAPFSGLFKRIYEKSKIKMKAYVAVQKKLLSIIYTLWKKEEAFTEQHSKTTSRDAEAAPSFGSAPQEPEKQKTAGSKQSQKVTLTSARATQDKHPSKPRRMPSFGSNEVRK
jgi:transposase